MGQDAAPYPFIGVALEQPSGRSPFPPIADYAFLSDCETNALVAPSGAVEWMCLPRPDSPSIFSALLDRGAGAFRLGPYDEMVPAARRYLPGSLVVETTWQTAPAGCSSATRCAWVRGTTWRSGRGRIAAHRPTSTPSTASCGP